MLRLNNLLVPFCSHNGQVTGHQHLEWVLAAQAGAVIEYRAWGGLTAERAL